MEGCMRDNMRKLALWHTRTFNPIITHDDLDAVMATKGFISLPPTTASSAHPAWKEYVFYAAATKSKTEPPPRPRLPFPRIDGLHIYTYRAFIDAVNFYLEMGDISDLFHIRGMPLHRVHDRNRRWVFMQEDDTSIFVYREGTLDQTIESFYNGHKHNPNAYACHSSSLVIRERSSNTSSACCIVPLEDV